MFIETEVFVFSIFEKSMKTKVISINPIFFRKMKLVWAATRENNLILTLDVRESDGFDQIVNADNLEAFQPYQLYTKELIASGIFGGTSS